MLKNLLTCERYLKHYNKDEKTVVACLNDTKNIYIVERNEELNRYFDNKPVKILCPEEHYLVGPIVDTLHAYEELGYSPEELKKIIEEHKKYRERSLFITTHLGTWNGPSEEKFREMKEALKRGNRVAALIADDINDDPVIKLLRPKVALPTTAREVVEQTQERMRTIAHLDEWARAQIAPSKMKPAYRYPKTYVERAIFNDPATIVFWRDGTKTVVKAQKGEKYDPEKGLAMAFSKKMFGNEGNYYDQFTKLLPKKNDKK